MYILDASILSDILFANILYSPYHIFSISSVFQRVDIFNLDEENLSFVFFNRLWFYVASKKSLPNLRSQRFSTSFSSKSSIISDLQTFVSMIHFGLTL